MKTFRVSYIAGAVESFGYTEVQCASLAELKDKIVEKGSYRLEDLTITEL